MSRHFPILLYFLFLFFASCEDKEKSSNNTITTTTGKEATTLDSVEVANTKSKELKEEEYVEGPLLQQEELIPFLTKYGEENPENRVKISTRFGDIEVLLYQDTPLHRANFIFMTKEGYFDTTVFHRVARGFVIQGGNSDLVETSRKRNEIGSFLIPSEFEAGHRHSRGAFSAAKYAEQNVSKASSPYEFFIVQSERGAHHLDNDHTVFGRVTSGMEVVDKIAQQEVDQGEWPLRNIHIEVEILE